MTCCGWIVGGYRCGCHYSITRFAAHTKTNTHHLHVIKRPSYEPTINLQTFTTFPLTSSNRKSSYQTLNAAGSHTENILYEWNQMVALFALSALLCMRRMFDLVWMGFYTQNTYIYIGVGKCPDWCLLRIYAATFFFAAQREISVSTRLYIVRNACHVSVPCLVFECYGPGWWGVGPVTVSIACLETQTYRKGCRDGFYGSSHVILALQLHFTLAIMMLVVE